MCIRDSIPPALPGLNIVLVLYHGLVQLQHLFDEGVILSGEERIVVLVQIQLHLLHLVQGRNPALHSGHIKAQTRCV